MPWFVSLISGLANSGNKYSNSSEMTFLNSILNKVVSKGVKSEAAKVALDKKDELVNSY